MISGDKEKQPNSAVENGEAKKNIKSVDGDLSDSELDNLVVSQKELIGEEADSLMSDMSEVEKVAENMHVPRVAIEDAERESGVDVKLGQIRSEAESLVVATQNNIDVVAQEGPENILAEHIEQDPRFKEIKFEMIDAWEKKTGQDILSADGQDFQFGDPTAFQRGEEPVTLVQLVKKVFKGRFPEVAQAYINKTATNNSRDLTSHSVHEDLPTTNDKIDEGGEKKTNEAVSMFREAGLPLNPILEGMLNEEDEHQGGRKGGGLTQASRHLAEFVRRPREGTKDLALFDDSVKDHIEDELVDEGGYDLLDTTPISSRLERDKIEAILASVKKPEMQLVLKMVADISKVESRIKKNEDLLTLPTTKDKTRVGTCTTAELYFLNYLADKVEDQDFVDHKKRINIVVDQKGEPLFIEKIGFGESHSALSLKPFVLNGVEVPPGSLVALQYDFDKEFPQTKSKKGSIIKSSDLLGVDFLRFTTLAVEPQDRARAFGNHLEFQVTNMMPKAETAKLEDFGAKARIEIPASH